MKVMLGRGWYQEVSFNEKDEQVIRYMKDDKEYSEEEWIKSKMETESKTKEPFISKIRRRVANKISPDDNQEHTHSYPFVELKWATPQSENKWSLDNAHYDYFKEFGHSGSDEEVWKWDREQLNIMYKALGLELVSTEFIPEHFIETENNIIKEG